MKKRYILYFLLMLSYGVNAQISGTVFRDFNNSGIKENTATFNEPFVSGTTVKATLSSGTSFTTTTDANGAYSFSAAQVPSGTSVRIEFIDPTGSSVQGTSNGTSVQFTTGGTSNVNYAVNNPDDYWNNTGNAIPTLMVVHQNRGTATNTFSAGKKALLQTTNAASGPNNPATSDAMTIDTSKRPAIFSEVGSTFSLAYQLKQQRFFQTAFMKRMCGFGPKGLGGVYIMTKVGADWDYTASFDLNGVTPSNGGGALDFGSVTRTTTPGTNAATANYISVNDQWSLASGAGSDGRDNDAFFKVGTMSIGGAEIDRCEDTLYLINIFQNKLLTVDISGSTASLNNATAAVLGPLTKSYSLSSLPGYPTAVGAGNNIRPFGIKFYRGKGYLGVVSDAMATQNASDLKGYILQFDPHNIAAGFTTILTINFNLYSNSFWHPWISTWAQTGGNNSSGPTQWPQPMITDIEFNEDGSMDIGIRDRWGDQGGSFEFWPVATPSTTAAHDQTNAQGDLLHVCNVGGNWVIEGTAGSCTQSLTNGSSASNNVGDQSSYNNTGKEYYGDRAGDGNPEDEFGGLAKLMGSRTIVSTCLDPMIDGATNGSNYWSTSGIKWNNNISGIKTQVARCLGGNFNNLDKANSLGDLEFVQECPKIQIGNRLWVDADNDGIQDAGEAPIPSATVELVGPGPDNTFGTADDAVLASTTTGPDGSYYFSTLSTADTRKPSTWTGIGTNDILPDNNYQVRVPLNQSAITTSNYLPVTSNANSNANDNIDSDGDPETIGAVTYSAITFNTKITNHNFDFGFAPSCTKPDAGPDQTTCFMNGTGTATLAAIGTGIWTEQPGNPGTSTIVSNTANNTVVNNFSVAGTYNYIWADGSCTDTVSIVVTPNGSIGNYVWNDINGNGTNDEAASAGINGVTVELWKETASGSGTYALSTSTTTANDGTGNPGYYNFTICESANYQVKFPTSNGGNNLTTQTSTASTDGNSDANPADGLSPVIVMDVNGTGTAKDNPTIDAAYRACGTLGNYVWNDLNGNGSNDEAASAGINGVTVELWKETAPGSGTFALSTSTTTANDGTGNPGYYNFTICENANYQVKFPTSNGGNNLTTQTSTAATDGNSDANPVDGLSPVIVMDVNGTGTAKDNPTIDAAYRACGTLGNYVWNDLNGNGSNDEAASAGINGVTVELWKETASGSGTYALSTSTTTANDGTGNPGYYNFTICESANYQVKFPTSNGGNNLTTQTSTASTDGNSDANPVDGLSPVIVMDVNGTGTAKDNPTIDAAYRACGTLGNYVWNDLNGNGSNDEAATAGINGVTVELWKETAPGSGTFALSTSTTTANDGTGNPGYYNFTICESANYQVKFPTSNGGNNLTTQTSTAATDGNSDANPADGLSPVIVMDVNGTGTAKDNPTIDAAYRACGSLGNYVWNDLNGNGSNDEAASAGINGVTVELWKETAPGSGTFALSTSTTTANDGTGNPGYYNFTICESANYQVKFPTSNGGNNLTTQTSTAATDGNSDANPADGLSPVIVMDVNGTGTAKDNPTIDAAYRACGSLGNYVWNDLNGNGSNDEAASAGINGVTVELWKETAPGSGTFALSTSTTTANDGTGNPGYYNFTICENANYKVKFPTSNAGTGLTSQTSTPATDGNNDANPSDGFSPVVALDISGTGTAKDNPTIDAGYYSAPVCVPPSAGSDLTACGGTCVNITGTSPTTGSWGADASNPAGATLGTTAAGIAEVCFATTASGTYNFIYSLGGGCEDTMSIVVTPKPDAGPDQTTCYMNGNGTATLAATGTGTWTEQAGNPGTSTIVSSTANNTVVNNFSASGTYNYIWTNNSCTDTVSVVVTPNGSVGNYVWNDINRDGINNEASSAGLNGVTVELWKETAPGSAVYAFDATTTTANDGTGNPGYYNFIICDNANYQVQFPTTIGAKSLTSQTTTAATDNNSDANTIDGLSPAFAIDVNGTGVAKDNNTIDAGYYQTAQLGNYVWNDLNHDGLQNNNEVGVSGVTISLVNSSNTILATTATDAYGYYLFKPLDPGTYKVIFSLPANYIFTTANAGADDATDSDPSEITGMTGDYVIVSGDSNMTVDAGIYQPQPITATVGDRVWFDANSNGIQDPGEQGVSGVTVTLCNNTGTPIATTITDANGNYIFENVVPGTYGVGFSLPIGTTFTTQSGTVSGTDNSDANTSTGKTSTFPVNAGDHITYVDAGIIPQLNTKASLGDKVWNDANQDGIQDPTETGVPGVTVTLYGADGITVIKTTTTDGLGNYSFTNLTPGCYEVGFSNLPSGFVLTAKNAGTDTTKNSDANTATGMTDVVCLTAGQNNPSIDAGIYNTSNTNSVGDKVWYDANKNGLQDANEYGYPGVVVTLCDNNGAPIANTVTDANGNYLFDGLPNGTYAVGFGFVPGYQFTSANADAAGILGANNSDANPSNGKTAQVSLTGNTHITTVDAGIYPGDNRTATSSLGDIVWQDMNQNGIQDAGETGVPGVTVTLYQADGTTPIATTITDGLGNYIFTNLTGGQYIVGFSNIPSGYTFTSQTGAVDDATNSDANTTNGKTELISLGLGEDKMTVDAGIYPPAGTASLGNYVWIDLNNDGLQDANEPPVPGVTVKLYDASNNVLSVATTNTDGMYLFSGLTPGSYYVGFENLPSGYVYTPQSGVVNDVANSDANPANGKTDPVTLASGDQNLNLDGGINSPTTAVVGNYVWYDLDADGIQDPNESPIPGVLVTMYDNTNTPVTSAVTDAEGKYLFTNVLPGTYTIGFEGYPAGLVATTKGANPAADDDSNIDPSTNKTNPFTVTPGSSNLTLDAGFKANPIAGLGNYVWNDVNHNGLQDATEPGIAGVIVTLYLSDAMQMIGTAVTDGNGYYSFPNLAEGNYLVEFSQPVNFIPTTFNVDALGIDGPVNSDMSVSTFQTAVVSLNSGTYNPNVDAGFYLNMPVPVTMRDFNVAVNDCKATLYWTTSSEQNTSHFEVKRKASNETTYKTISTIVAAGNSQLEKHYSYQDLSVVEGAYDYKLRIVDIDLKSSETGIETANIHCSGNDLIEVYPNPTTESLNVNIKSTLNEEYTILVRDLSGRVLMNTTTMLENQSKVVKLDVVHLAQGVYTVQVSNSVETKVFKIEIAH